jgi:hypothetical protein
MVLSKLAVKGFNFIVRNGKGELVKSVLCSKHSKVINFKNLKYLPQESNNGRIPLDIKSEACEFFGVADIEKLNEVQHLLNHAYLTEAYEKKGIVGFSGADKIKNFIESVFGEKYVRGKGHTSFWEQISADMFDPTVRAGKITFSGYTFKNRNAFHTVGFVKKYNHLYILDSLGEETPEQIELHKFWKESIEKYFNDRGRISPLIRFNKTTQQGQNDLTCNNWTYGNIEAMVKHLKARFECSSSQEIDNVLPKDINVLLEKQMNEAINNQYLTLE